MKVLTNFAGQNWLITPAALAVGENLPASIHDQKFLLVLSGVVIADLEGNSGSQWLHETLSFLPDMAGPQNSGPLNWAINRFAIPKPPGQNFSIGFSLEEWAPFASLSSIFNQDQSINSGFAVDVWRPTHFSTGTDAFTHSPVGNIFTGVNVDVAVRDTDAWIFRVGYNITLLGKIVFLTSQTALFKSNFDPTPDGQPPSTVQAVGTARIEGPPRSVIVIDPPFPHTNKWVQILGGLPLTDGTLDAFVGVLTEVPGDGIYNFSAALFIPAHTDVVSIGFETPVQQFLHIDFRSDNGNKVRVDDNPATDFGSFPRDQVFLVEVILNISAAQSTARIILSGGSASGDSTYTLPPPSHFLSRQFGAIRLWQGFLNTGGFDATNIVVTREV
jgi:hypothetical protein